MLKERLAKRLKNLREENHWTQEMAAELCSLSPRFWGKIEQCKASPSIETLEKIAKGLNISVEDLLKEGEVDKNEEV